MFRFLRRIDWESVGTWVYVVSIVLVFLMHLGLMFGAGYVVWHFVQKYW